MKVIKAKKGIGYLKKENEFISVKEEDFRGLLKKY